MAVLAGILKASDGCVVLLTSEKSQFLSSREDDAPVGRHENTSGHRQPDCGLHHSGEREIPPEGRPCIAGAFGRGGGVCRGHLPPPPAPFAAGDRRASRLQNKRYIPIIPVLVFLSFARCVNCKLPSLTRTVTRASIESQGDKSPPYQAGQNNWLVRAISRNCKKGGRRTVGGGLPSFRTWGRSLIHTSGYISMRADICMFCII